MTAMKLTVMESRLICCNLPSLVCFGGGQTLPLRRLLGETSMRFLSACVSIFCIAWLTCVSVGPASAQATRTWVSGVGDDGNTCGRTDPCKTFAGAISKTAAGGTINCLDPGGYGSVTITKSISILCSYTEGGVLVS